MSEPGMGVLINRLFGGDDNKAFRESVGKTISAISIDDNSLHFSFADGTKIGMFDDGQSCCETRYMRTDDDLPYYVGSVLQGGKVEDGPDSNAEYDVHETQFLKIETSKGVFTVVNHVEHNGYYGGFYIVTKVED